MGGTKFKSKKKGFAPFVIKLAKQFEFWIAVLLICYTADIIVLVAVKPYLGWIFLRLLV